MPAGGTGSSGRSRCAASTRSTTSSSGTHSPTTSCKGTGSSPPPRSPDDRNIVRNSAYRLSVDRKQATTLSCPSIQSGRDATIASRALTRLSQLKQKSLEYQGGTLKSLHYRAGAAA